MEIPVLLNICGIAEIWPSVVGMCVAWLKNRKVPSLSPGQGNLVNKCSYNYI